jgi:hypothetical protein
MHRSTRRSPLSLLQLGWTVFALGVAWDLIYHAALFLVSVPLSSSLDLVGSFGHVVTFGGTVIIIYALLRRHSK